MQNIYALSGVTDGSPDRFLGLIIFMSINKLWDFIKTIEQKSLKIEYYKSDDIKLIPKEYYRKYTCIYFILHQDNRINYIGQTINIW